MGILAETDPDPPVRDVLWVCPLCLMAVPSPGQCSYDGRFMLEYRRVDCANK